jgi:hypothetical protein
MFSQSIHMRTWIFWQIHQDNDEIHLFKPSLCIFMFHSHLLAATPKGPTAAAPSRGVGLAHHLAYLTILLIQGVGSGAGTF